MMQSMETDLHNLRIDRTAAPAKTPRSNRRLLFSLSATVVVAVAGIAYAALSRPLVVSVMRVQATVTTNGSSGSEVTLNATGYVVAAHTIELASKVVGKVAWIGVDKGDHVREGQELVRLEDQEYRAQLLQSKGQLDNLKAHLAQLENGSRPEEIQRAKADEDAAQVDLANARISLHRTLELEQDGVLSRQVLDDTQAKYDSAAARTASLARTYDLARIGARREEIDAARAQMIQAQGAYDYAKVELENTVIRAPVAATILDRNVEKGEFVTNGFVGDKGAKGYVVSLADLNDLEVELDINQSDFSKISPTETAWVTTDAYPDRKYEAHIAEISPEANRQKGTVQVKVTIVRPDAYLRPDMNASVAFVAAKQSKGNDSSPPARTLRIPISAVRKDSVFVVAGGRAAKQVVTLGKAGGSEVEVRSGLVVGEDLVVNPPANLKDGDKVRVRKD
jgi:HlyD family secretion protein